MKANGDKHGAQAGVKKFDLNKIQAAYMAGRESPKNFDPSKFESIDVLVVGNEKESN